MDRVYKVFIKRFYEYANLNRIETDKARKILRIIFRVPKEDVSAVLHDMHTQGLIEASNCRFIALKVVI